MNVYFDYRARLMDYDRVVDDKGETFKYAYVENVDELIDLMETIGMNIFNLPNFCLTNLQFKKDSSRFFKNEFPELNNREIFDLINFLYPSKDGTFEDIVANKNNTFDFLNKIFDKITSVGKFVIVVDNFDFIDGFSYEFLSKFISMSAQ